jgi:hypothetical protein
MLLNGAAQIEETALPLRLPVSLVCPRPKPEMAMRTHFAQPQMARRFRKLNAALLFLSCFLSFFVFLALNRDVKYVLRMHTPVDC